VYIADDEARKIMETTEVTKAIKEVFGPMPFEGTILNRDKLATIVFNDSKKLQQLNAIVHPVVKQDFKQWLLEHNESPIVIYEAAILFESGNYKDFDFIITVTAPLESRIQRVISRDKTTLEQVLKRINVQWTDEQRILNSDYVIVNDEHEIAKRESDEILKILRIKQNDS
jgi:dephospho-CoA kinase